jgi:hypothetical protein
MQTAKQILKQEIVNGVLHTYLKAKKAPKQVTAKGKGSLGHCGRTNVWGVSV